MTSRLSRSCRILSICLALSAASAPAHAQSHVYVSGDLFAEVMRLSRTTVTPENTVLSGNVPVDGVTAGGGARVGAFFSPEWSLELGVDLGKTIARTQTVSIPGLAGLGSRIVAPQFQARTSIRFSAATASIGYHPPARGRVHPGFRGGLSFMRTERTSTSGNLTSITIPPFTGPGPAPLPVLSIVTSELTSISNGLTATLGAEATIELSRHFAVVPEMRVHAGGLGGFVLRPGASARWLW